MPVVQPPPKRIKLADAHEESLDTDALLWGIEPSKETPEEAPVVDETQEEAPVDLRPHKCSYAGCIKDYVKQGELAKHVREFHLKEKNFKCEYDGCGSAFPTESKLKRHICKHTGEKGFSCTWDGCTRACVTQSDLDKHLRMHKNEKPYKCTWSGCDMTFSQSSNVDAHIRSNHTGEKSFKCEWDGCDQSFTTAYCLWGHEIRKHKDQGSAEVKEFRKKTRDARNERYKEDMAYRAHCLCSSGFNSWKQAKGGVKTMRMEALVGISWAELVIWLEDNEEGLTLDMDDIDVDHWRPKSSFDLFDPIQLRECWNWNNLRLMRSRENRHVKRAFYDAEMYATTSAGKAIAELRKGWAVEFPEYA